MYSNSCNTICSMDLSPTCFVYYPAESHTNVISDILADKNNNLITRNYVIANTLVADILGLKDNSICEVLPYRFYYLTKNLTNVVFDTDAFRMKNGINSIVNGYTEKEEKKVVKAYPMADKNNNLITRNYIIANAALEDISGLKDNWNDNGAKCFSRQLVEKCQTIVNDLVAEPFVCPTARGSIQFEYEKEDGDYLEFEVFEDRIEVYSDTKESGEREFNLKGITATDKMKQLVVDFYG